MVHPAVPTSLVVRTVRLPTCAHALPRTLVLGREMRPRLRELALFCLHFLGMFYDPDHGLHH
jgi:hypothetical protein